MNLTLKKTISEESLMPEEKSGFDQNLSGC